jgi:hypothetical protein
MSHSEVEVSGWHQCTLPGWQQVRGCVPDNFTALANSPQPQKVNQSFQSVRSARRWQSLKKIHAKPYQPADKVIGTTSRANLGAFNQVIVNILTVNSFYFSI